jgi:Zn-dependent peptidase ImmA (M78 family)
MMRLTRAQIAASKVLHSLGWKQPGDLTLDEIAYASNAFIKESVLKGSEGRILMKGEDAVITIDATITYEPRRNFVLAHEIGHLTLHKKIAPLFSDTIKTLSEWHARGPQELEANQFASELLMPSALFNPMVQGEEMSLDFIREVADYFGASQTATLLKYKDVGDFPISIIYAEDAVVKWKSESTDFPFTFLPRGTKIPEGSAAADFFQGQDLEEEPVLVDALDWFPEDFEMEKYLTLQLFEHNFRIGTNGLLTCLWTE